MSIHHSLEWDLVWCFVPPNNYVIGDRPIARFLLTRHWIFNALNCSKPSLRCCSIAWKDQLEHWSNAWTGNADWIQKLDLHRIVIYSLKAFLVDVDASREVSHFRILYLCFFLTQQTQEFFQKPNNSWSCHEWYVLLAIFTSYSQRVRHPKVKLLVTLSFYFLSEMRWNLTWRVGLDIILFTTWNVFGLPEPV